MIQCWMWFKAAGLRPREREMAVKTGCINKQIEWMDDIFPHDPIDLLLLTISPSPSALANPQDVKMVPFHFLEDLSCSWGFPRGSDIPSTGFDVVFSAEQTIQPKNPIGDHSASREAWVRFRLFDRCTWLFWSFHNNLSYGAGLLARCPTPNLEDQWVVLRLASNLSTCLDFVTLPGDCAPAGIALGVIEARKPPRPQQGINPLEGLLTPKRF